MSAPIRRLEPGQSYCQVHIVAASYGFAQPGEYVVRASLLAPTRGRRVVLTEEDMPIAVDPANPERLEARCQEFFEMICEPTPETRRIPATAALMSIRDDAVLPYLDFLARRYPSGASSVCRAVLCVGTPRSEALLMALAERSDQVGHAARRALPVRGISASAAGSSR